MATKTLILRPTSTLIPSSNNIKNYTPFPSDTSAENMYMLVTEEIADDDATYISTKMTLPSGGINFTVPGEYTNITPKMIRLFTRVKTESATGITSSPYLLLSGHEDLSVESYEYTVDNYDVYETYLTEILEVDMEALWTNLVNGNFGILLGVSNTTASGSKSANSVEVRYTQMYIEIDYDDGIPDGPIAYIKKGTNWVQTDAIYIKQNGSWIECDENTLTNGTQYRVTHIT